MVETITFRPIYIEDLALGTGTEQVTLADGSVAALTKVNLTTLASGVASGSSYLDLSQQSSTPATPAASTTRLYQKTDGYWYVLSSAGVDTEWPSTLGTVSRGTWNGTAISVPYGGTGLSALVAGDLVYASATDTASRLAIGTSGYVLKSTGTAPTWAQAPYTSIIGGSGLLAATTVYCSPYGYAVNVTNESYAVVWPAAGTFSKFYLSMLTTHTADIVATVRVNGADTSLTATVATGATTGSDTSNTASVTAGQIVSVKLYSTATFSSVVRWGFLFTE